MSTLCFTISLDQCFLHVLLTAQLPRSSRCHWGLSDILLCLLPFRTILVIMACGDHWPSIVCHHVLRCQEVSDPGARVHSLIDRTSEGLRHKGELRNFVRPSCQEQRVNHFRSGNELHSTRNHLPNWISLDFKYVISDCCKVLWG